MVDAEQRLTRSANPPGAVAVLMIENVIAVKPEQTPHDVVEIPKHNRIRRVVVCDDENRVQGMITRSELVRVFFGRPRKPPNDGA